MSMEEAELVRANPEVAESLGIEAPPKAKRTRKARKLAWNERQYGAGVIAGIFIGICIGVPLDAILAVAAKMFIVWLGRF